MSIKRNNIIWLSITMTVFVVILLYYTSFRARRIIKTAWGDVAGCFIREYGRPSNLAIADYVDVDQIENGYLEKTGFMEIYKSGKGECKIQFTSDTLEGDPVQFYLSVNNGILSLIVDRTRDRWGPRVFSEFQLRDVKLGYRKATDDGESDYYISYDEPGGLDQPESLVFSLYRVKAEEYGNEN